MRSMAPMRAPTHYLRVDLDDAAEAEYWLVVFDTTRDQLERAVATVGRDAQDVRSALVGACLPAN